ncbi:hypothetical protein POTOM_038916 [Populus tomentosa]|uniref:Core Histone H2A/H2B/H3 domain-containing protein n=1 Tax=Populus tomentosa TaxID=118781 RepID=A0A8X8CLT6_POPTO|nr:hypothetical protein POTOM_038916 [Populus tomentosa]
MTMKLLLVMDPCYYTSHLRTDYKDLCLARSTNSTLFGGLFKAQRICCQSQEKIYRNSVHFSGVKFAAGSLSFWHQGVDALSPSRQAHPESIISLQEQLERKEIEIDTVQEQLERQEEMETRANDHPADICTDEQEMDTLRSSDMGPETEISNLQNAKQRQGNFREEVVRAGYVAGSTVKMSNDRESNLVELHNLEPRNTGLQEETRIMESETEAQKKPNAELRKQKMELHEHCAVLVAELRDSELFFSCYAGRLKLELSESNLKDVKSKEEKHKSIVKGAGIKTESSAYEKQQVTGETSSLRIQLLKTSVLQDEIPDLKRSLNEVKFENKKLESSLHILSGVNEELKAEKILSMQEIPDMQRAIAELGDCRHGKVSLEEKLFPLEGDLTARKAIGAQDDELKMSLPGGRRRRIRGHDIVTSAGVARFTGALFRLDPWMPTLKLNTRILPFNIFSGLESKMAPKAEKKPAEKKPAAAEKAPAEKKPRAEKKLPKEGASEKKKKKSKKGVETYKIYIFKVLKQVHPDIGISSKAMGIMNSFINDIFEKLAQESSRLARYNKKPTITSREIQTAVRLVLPGELAKHAVSEGTKAVTKFTSS